MARLHNQLTVLKVGSLKEAGYFADGQNLYLQVALGGAKSWIFKYRYANKRHEMGLGSALTISLKGARKMAAQHRETLAKGENPLVIKRQKQSALRLSMATQITFDQAVDAYIKSRESDWKNAKHKSQWQNTLKQYASPIMGSLDIKSVDLSLILKLLEPIWQTKNETASRIRGRLEKVLDWATVRGYRSGLNPARWKGHLDVVLPAPSKIQVTSHLRSLPYSEVASFMSSLKKQSGFGALALEMVVLTAARSGEVRGATWDEIDLKNRIWIVPAHRMKTGKEHRVPLSEQAIELLKRLPRFEGENLLFPSRKRNTPLSDMVMTATIRRMGFASQTTTHGFRSCFRVWAAEQTDFPREICEQALAHNTAGEVEQAYQRSDHLEKRRSLMQQWANFSSMMPNSTCALKVGQEDFAL